MQLEMVIISYMSVGEAAEYFGLSVTKLRPDFAKQNLELGKAGEVHPSASDVWTASSLLGRAVQRLLGRCE